MGKVLKFAIKALGIVAIATVYGFEGMWIGYGIAAKEDKKLNWAPFDDPERKQILENRIAAAKHLDELEDFMPSTEETFRDAINFRAELES